MDGLADAHVGRAAAEVGHRSVDVAIARGEVLLEQVRGRYDHAGLAVSALRHVELAPGAPHRVIGVGCEVLDGRHLPALDGGDWDDAASGRYAVNMHRARPARPNAAAELAAGQAELFAHDPEQRHIRRAIELRRLLVDRERHRHGWLELICRVPDRKMLQSTPAGGPARRSRRELRGLFPGDPPRPADPKMSGAR